MAKSIFPASRSATVPESRSNVAIFTFDGFAVTRASPMALFRHMTAFMPGWAWRYVTTWPIAWGGLEAALGVLRMSSVQATPLAGGFFVEHEERPRPAARPAQRSRRF